MKKKAKKAAKMPPVPKAVRLAAERWWASITNDERDRLEAARMEMALARARFDTLNAPLTARYDAIKDSLPMPQRLQFMRYARGVWP